ncbi:MAG: 1-deoxy-D-xylulose-5-phosphate reductoisomerase [Thermodesulfovibrionales bacterium]|nr:1-deoxy-D-xylulose-5-phosphate reductoisomerase [Thermodesulfovibrionales bacterium]
MKNIVILGSTGSIGKNSLEVIKMFPDKFRVVGLTADSNVSVIVEQIKEFVPEIVAIADSKAFGKLKGIFRHNTKPVVLCGLEGVCAVAQYEKADIVISAISGSAGLLPTLSAIRAKKTVALANKEALVTAGHIVMTEASKYNSAIIPIDSEHSAIFQCLNGSKLESVRRIILTASGGPFIGKTKDQLQNVTYKEALKHPKWKMGKKISIDSATLMNKGLEVIEAHHLFNIPPERIDVLIHPQSLVHSIVEFQDGSFIAQMSMPDMKGPIAYALSYPERLNNVMVPVKWEKVKTLNFYEPDNKTFPSLALAYAALKEGGTMPTVLNASNEVAVKAFLDEIIGFNDIPVIIKKVMDLHKNQPAESIEIILTIDRWARNKTIEEISK